MKPITFLACALVALCTRVNTFPTTIPTIFPNPDTVNCGNGILCASSQTCMSNATGAGIIYACSPLPNAVRCMDARFSCPRSSTCIDESKCMFTYDNSNTNTNAYIDAVVNVDAVKVDAIRDFGNGMKPTAFSICGTITTNFRLPNFCTCTDARFGGDLTCAIGLQTYISIGASAWFLPCASPANFGYRAWASILGTRRSVGRTWTSAFSTNIPIPGATFELGVASVGAHAELSGDISRFIISTRFAVGVCARIGIGFFSKDICNPSNLRWLPVTILNGPRFDFTRLC
jgi:hypothetical protein